MSSAASMPGGEIQAASPERTLRKLFLTLFLRGRGARGLRKETAPKSVGQKLAGTLALYGLMGFLALIFVNQPVFNLSLYLHGMTFMFLGTFVAASAGEVLFNKEEADILMHRPVTPRALLWAKIGVLIEVSLWMAGVFNLIGLFAGMGAPNGSWLFPIAHIISTCLEALFCTASVVFLYQLCLRWFGRERLDSLMTMAQVLLAIGTVVGSQLVPQVMKELGGTMQHGLDAGWVLALPPAWFAGFDDAVAGTRATGSWILAAPGLLATLAVVWLAFGKLARDYNLGLQALNEGPVARPQRHGGRRRWLDLMVNVPPLRWWLRDSVTRAGFLLSAAYLLRDRDVKLRVYPGLAPMLIMPLIFLVRDRTQATGSFGVSFAATFLAIIPMLALNLLQFSQQWQAADIFRAAPLAGPARLCRGARRAVLVLLTAPVILFYAVFLLLTSSDPSRLLALLPGLIGLPLYALVPCLGGRGVPLSEPPEEAKSANRGVQLIGVMLLSMALSGVALWAMSAGWLGWLLLAEVCIGIPVYWMLRTTVENARWAPLE
jgi:ABC-2 type transport system permease protein